MFARNPIQLLLALAPALVASAPLVDDNSPIPGYRVEDMVWEVQAFAGGPVMNLTGTAEQVHHELVRLNPDFKARFATRPLQAHADFEGADYNCYFGPYPTADQLNIENGIEYLRRVEGRPTQGPGPGACSRVSCSWGAGIWVCNDAPKTATLDSYGDIADGAQFILDRCAVFGGNSGYIKGQVFHPSNWNVIVRGGEDC